MLRYEVDKGLAGGGPGALPLFVAACHFNAAADFQKGIGAHGTEIMGDKPWRNAASLGDSASCVVLLRT
jgi:hypothetical protein